MGRLVSALEDLQRILESGGTLPELQMGSSPDGSFWAFSTYPVRTLWALESPLPPGTIEELLKVLSGAGSEDLFLIVLGKEGELLVVVRDASEPTIFSMAALIRRPDGWMLQRAAWQEGKMTSKEDRLPIAPDSGTAEALRFLLEKVIQEAKNASQR